MKFTLKEDLIFDVAGFKHKVLDKGFVIEPNENGEYLVTIGSETKNMTIDEVRNTGLFEEDKPISTNNLDIRIEEVQEGYDDIVKKWRIQLDVTTSKRKLLEFESVFKECVKNILGN